MGVREIFRLYLAVMAAFAPFAAVAQPVSGTVVSVHDGDTFTLANGEKVRLLDINSPEVAHDGIPAQPYGNAAGDELRKLVLGKQVTLEYGPQTRDVYERLLAHVRLADGTWVNARMVEDGMAHVYTFADNALHGNELLALEAKARATKKGLWQDARWSIRSAATCCAASDIGTYVLVEGRVIRAGRVKDRTYLNFGNDWRTDFTAFVAKKDEKWFKKAGIKDIGTFYTGKTVRVRGVAQPVNGIMVRVTHPYQIDVVP